MVMARATGRDHLRGWSCGEAAEATWLARSQRQAEPVGGDARGGPRTPGDLVSEHRQPASNRKDAHNANAGAGAWGRLGREATDATPRLVPLLSHPTRSHAPLFPK